MENKLKYTMGDLLALLDDGEFEVVAHGCNCFHTMGSGIAKQFADKYPEVASVDQLETTYADSGKLGHFTFAKVLNKYNQYAVIFNLYTQFSTGGRAISYDAIYEAFERLSKKVPVGKKIGLPQIGAGLGGGSWDVIEAMINHTLIKDGHDVTIVTFDG